MRAAIDGGERRIGDRDLGDRIGFASVENKLGFIDTEGDLTVEAGASAGVASAAVAAGFDRQKQGVLVAIGPDFRDFLNLARRLALAPKRLA